MGIPSDLESRQQLTAFDSPEDKELLQKFDNHLANIKQSLALARKSMDKIHVLVDYKEGENKPGSNKPLNDLKSVCNEQHVKGQVTEGRSGRQNQQNREANHEDVCQYVSVTVTTDVTSRVIPTARRVVSSNFNVNYNASDPALPQESESNIDQTLPEETDLDQTPPEEADLDQTPPEEADLDQTLPEETDLDQTLPEETDLDQTFPEEADLDQTFPEEADLNQTLGEEAGLNQKLGEDGGLDQGSEYTTVEIEAPESTVEIEVESVQEVIVNMDTLPTPSIVIISATPYEHDIEDFEQEEKTGLVKISVSSDKRVSKQVSFNETALKEVIPAGTVTTRASLDESSLVIAESRKLDEETKRKSLKRTHSSDTIIRSASKVLEEIKQAHEAEAAAKLEASDKKVEATTVATNEMFSFIKVDDKVLHLTTDRRSKLEADVDQRDRERSISMRSEQDVGSFCDEAVDRPRSLTQVLKTIDRVIYKDGVAMMWKQLAYSDVEVLVPVPPNSVLNDTLGSTPSGTTVEKERTRKFPRESCDAFVKRKLGAAAYRYMFKTPTSPEGKAKIPGADWDRQLKSQRYFSMPPILYWEQWRTNTMMKNCLGPGSYEMKDFIQLGNEKPRSERGVCDKLGPRFDKMAQSATPGPGTYGIGGIPHKALEDRANRSFSTKGMLDTGDRNRNLPFQGCDLAPCTYNHKSSLDELLNKVTGLRGPYDLFTPRRHDPVKAGFYITPKYTKIGPGYYKYQSFVEELAASKYNYRGRFSKQAQYPEVPTDRFTLFSSATPSLDKETPGPGAYDVKELPKYTTVNTPGFLSSAKRSDKLSERMFTMTCHNVGPGRYYTEKSEQPHVNGHTNVFKSNSGKPSLKMARFYEFPHVEIFLFSYVENVFENAEHVLQHCRLYDANREAIRPVPTSIKTKLYGTKRDLDCTIAFIKATGLLI